MTEIAIVTRKDAKASGLKHYFTGKPCKRGHVSLRLTVSSSCIDCFSEWWRESDNPERRAVATSRAVAWAKENPGRARENKVRWASNNPEKVAKSKARTNEKRSARRKIERKTNPEFMLREALSTMAKRIARLTGKKKKFKTMEALGYSVLDLKERIESQFKPGMSWENRGEWHIDHIKPVSAFIRDGVEDVAVINALDNLQPLWAAENYAKRDRYSG